ncbi:MAG: 50S ribosomal protein L32e [Candidatus Micrarchaeota archaeon]|nr:50S ribosomal protein L32e [Candidatus Micrarchaeota archaeon]
MDGQEDEWMNPKHKPKFRRSNYGRTDMRRVKDNWRAPMGIDNKKREKLKAFGGIPSIGYGAPRATKYLHPSGLEEAFITSPLQVSEKLAGKAIRIASQLGKRSRLLVREKAAKLGIKVLN